MEKRKKRIWKRVSKGVEEGSRNLVVRFKEVDERRSIRI